MSHRIRGRKDHYLPQAYLRGFIDPSQAKEQRPLWLFQIPCKTWKRCNTAEIGFIRGFYDYSKGIDPSLQTADQSFADLERNFTPVLREIAANNFSNWLEHRDFLLRFMQMIRARSPLYFEQKRATAKNSAAWVIDEINIDRNQLKVRPAELPEHFVKNRSLIEMMEEIQKGSDWLNKFDWALRYTDLPENSFFASDTPFGVSGPVEGQHQHVSWNALQHPDTLFFFPLCWRACIVGSPRLFDIKTDKATLEFVRQVRHMYRTNARAYLISPVKLDESSNGLKSSPEPKL